MTCSKTRSHFNGEFFHRSPHFCLVLAILLCLTGVPRLLPFLLSNTPTSPPNVRITANYPGASAQTLENTVTQVIEQNMTGLDNLMYMSSQSSATGRDGNPELYGGHGSGRSGAAGAKPAAIGPA